MRSEGLRDSGTCTQHTRAMMRGKISNIYLVWKYEDGMRSIETDKALTLPKSAKEISACLRLITGHRKSALASEGAAALDFECMDWRPTWMVFVVAL